jgi:N-acetylglucosaminyldiphosphoundecaprenol N-acetyl-beta-D-mannosaminyltransferase
MEKIRIGKAWFDNITMTECLEKIRDSLGQGNKGFIIAANVDNVLILERDSEFRSAYENAQIVLADGMPLILASRLLGTPLKEKVSGSDLFPSLCRLAAGEGYKLFFLGGEEGVARKAADHFQKSWENLRVVGMYSPPFGFEKNDAENRRIIHLINQARPDILFVALGAPKQEKWMCRHLPELEVVLALGVGASFDFAAGTKKRAPVLWQKASLEWFWRFLQEPRRLFKRYFIDDLFPFAFLVLKQLLEK